MTSLIERAEKQLIHYSKEPIGELSVVSLERQEKFEGGLFKPLGLWVSIKGEDDWLQWCVSENFGLERLAFETEIALLPAANALWLKNARDIDAFHRDYRISKGDEWKRNYIFWPKVAEDYDAIFIAPYIWERRLEGEAHKWYYGWGCASGCIWNTNVVKAGKSWLRLIDGEQEKEG